MILYGKTSKVNFDQVSMDCSPCERNYCEEKGFSLDYHYFSEIFKITFWISANHKQISQKKN